jgi:hypothetical protein
VPAFLSPEWLDRLGASLPPVDPTLAVRIRQVVTDLVTYDVVFAGGAGTIETDSRAAPDLTLELSYPVAAALSAGRASAHDALQAGEIKIAGDLRLLPTLGPALAALGPALAAVRDATTYP